MWALGVVVFLMLYGKYPFEGSDQKAIVVCELSLIFCIVYFASFILHQQAILNGQPEYVSRSAAPSQLAIDFMNRLLEKDPDRRLSPDDG